jgi:hypothetical protein
MSRRVAVAVLVPVAAGLAVSVAALMPVGRPVAEAADHAPPPANPAIDMAAFLKLSAEAAKHRETRRVAEADFIRMSREAGTVVLDARSKGKYDLLHIRGAVNLSFPDITVDSLAKLIPDKGTRILIYCNNNFRNSEDAFPSKLPPASLNLSTYVSLYTYGYRNVYELAPLLDPKTSKLEFEGTGRP